MFESGELEKWVGGLILTGFGAICTGLWATGKLIWSLSKIDSKIDSTHAMAVRAHKRIDKLSGDTDDE